MSGPYNVQSKVLVAFAHLLVPLVRILLRNGISFRDFAEVTKSVFARVCAKEFAMPDRRMTKSRIAIMTGLTRKEVAEILDSEDHTARVLQSNFHRIARVLNGWHNDQDFLGPYGMPRELFFDSDPTGAATFSDLVRRYSGDMPARAVLDEVLHSGAATRAGEKGAIRAVTRAYVPKGTAPEALEAFARGVRRYAETVDFNLNTTEPTFKRFERAVWPEGGIRPEDWDRFRHFVKQQLEPVIEGLDHRLDVFRTAPDKAPENLSVGIGFYIYRDELEEAGAFEELLSAAARAVPGDDATPVVDTLGSED